MFIFIYNTLVLDVKRIDFEARMIDTLRSSSRILLFLFFFIYCSPAWFFFLVSIQHASIYICYAATSKTGNCSARMYGTYIRLTLNVPNIFMFI